MNCIHCAHLLKMPREKNSHAYNQFLKDLESGKVKHIKTQDGRPIYKDMT